MADKTNAHNEINAQNLRDAFDSIGDFISAKIGEQIVLFTEKAKKTTGKGTDISTEKPENNINEPDKFKTLKHFMGIKKPSPLAEQRREGFLEAVGGSSEAGDTKAPGDRNPKVRMVAIVDPALREVKNEYYDSFSPIEKVAYTYLVKHDPILADIPGRYSDVVIDTIIGEESPDSFFPRKHVSQEMFAIGLKAQLTTAIKELKDKKITAGRMLRNLCEELSELQREDPIEFKVKVSNALKEAGEKYDKRLAEYSEQNPSKHKPSKHKPSKHKPSDRGDRVILEPDSDIGSGISGITAPDVPNINTSAGPSRKGDHRPHTGSHRHHKKKSRWLDTAAKIGVAAASAGVLGGTLHYLLKDREKPEPPERPVAKAKADENNAPPPVVKPNPPPVAPPEEKPAAPKPEDDKPAEAPAKPEMPAGEKKPADGGAPAKPNPMESEPARPDFARRQRDLALAERARHIRELLGENDEALTKHFRDNYITAMQQRSSEVPDLPDPPKKPVAPKDRTDLTLLLPKNVKTDADGNVQEIQNIEEEALKTTQIAGFINAPDKQTIIIPAHAGSFSLEANTNTGKFYLLDENGQHMVDKKDGKDLEIDPSRPLVIGMPINDKGGDLKIPLDPVGGVHQLKTGIVFKHFYPGEIHFVDMGIDIRNMQPLNVTIPQRLSNRTPIIDPKIEDGKLNYVKWSVAGDCELQETCEQAVAPAIRLQKVHPGFAFRLEDEGCRGMTASVRASDKAWALIAFMLNMNKAQPGSLKIIVRQDDAEIVNALAEPYKDIPLEPMNKGLEHLVNNPNLCRRKPTVIRDLVNAMEDDLALGRYMQDYDKNGRSPLDSLRTYIRSVADAVDPLYVNAHALYRSKENPLGLGPVPPNAAVSLADGKEVLGLVNGGDIADRGIFAKNITKLMEGVGDKFAAQPSLGEVTFWLEPLAPEDVAQARKKAARNR